MPTRPIHDRAELCALLADMLWKSEALPRHATAENLSPQAYEIIAEVEVLIDELRAETGAGAVNPPDTLNLEILRQLAERNISAMALAADLGIARQSVSAWLSGRAKPSKANGQKL